MKYTDIYRYLKLSLYYNLHFITKILVESKTVSMSFLSCYFIQNFFFYSSSLFFIFLYIHAINYKL